MKVPKAWIILIFLVPFCGAYGNCDVREISQIFPRNCGGKLYPGAWCPVECGRSPDRDNFFCVDPRGCSATCLKNGRWKTNCACNPDTLKRKVKGAHLSDYNEPCFPGQFCYGANCGDNLEVLKPITCDAKMGFQGDCGCKPLNGTIYENTAHEKHLCSGYEIGALCPVTEICEKGTRPINENRLYDKLVCTPRGWAFQNTGTTVPTDGNPDEKLKLCKDLCDGVECKTECRPHGICVSGVCKGPFEQIGTPCDGTGICTSSGKCECAPGSFGPADKCKDCPPGRFSPDHGSLWCEKCEPGRFTPSPGATSCMECEGNPMEPPVCMPPGCTDETDCDNGLFCDGMEECEGGSCKNGTNPCDNMFDKCDQELVCNEEDDDCDSISMGDCDDDKVCTIDCTLPNGGCEFPPEMNGTVCDIDGYCDEEGECIGSGFKCETGWGKAIDNTTDTCFLEFNNMKGRWGWANGPMTNFTYVMDLWAGAGQCVLDKGTLVGNISVESDGMITFDLTSTDWFLTEVQVDIYNCTSSLEKPPSIAPGQFEYIFEGLNGNQTFELTVNEDLATDNRCILAHVVTCNKEEELVSSGGLTDPAPSEVPTDPAPSEVPTDPAPSEVPTDPTPSEGPTDPAPSEAPTDPAPSEAPTDSTPSEGPTDPAPSEGPTDPAPSESLTDPAPSEVPTDPTPSEGPTDPAPSEAPTDPAPSEAPTDSTPSEGLTDPAPSEALTDPAPSEGLTDPAPSEAPTGDGNGSCDSISMGACDDDNVCTMDCTPLEGDCYFPNKMNGTVCDINGYCDGDGVCIGSSFDCETGWGKAIDNTTDTCFLNIDGIKGNRWGWANGRMTSFPYVMDLWAGAGQCILSSGYLVGNISVESNGTITFDLTSSEWFLIEVQVDIYDCASSDEAPPSIAPGQFDYIFEGLNGNETFDLTVSEDLATNDRCILAHVVTYRVDKMLVLLSEKSAKIGDFVWHDKNYNSVRDDGEIGFAGVTVECFVDVDLDGTPDEGWKKTVATTDANGEYWCSDLIPYKRYIARVTDTSNKLDGYGCTGPGCESHVVTSLKPDETYDLADFGYNQEPKSPL